MTYIDGRTRVTGLIGDPVEHSLSPAMHNAAYKKSALNYCYLPFCVRTETLNAAIKAITALGMVGVNVTAPHKERAVHCVDRLSPEAAFLGAINTIKNDNNHLSGYNTDVDGFLYLLDRGLPDGVNKGRALLMGAGGAAKAVCLALARRGVESLLIVNRALERAEKLAVLLVEAGCWPEGSVQVLPLGKKALQDPLQSTTLLINALSVDPYELGFLPAAGTPGHLSAIDLRYSPPKTPFLMWAERSGATAVNGLDMLLGQGMKAFQIFTGVEPPRLAMEEALLNALEGRVEPGQE